MSQSMVLTGSKRVVALWVALVVALAGPLAMYTAVEAEATLTVDATCPLTAGSPLQLLGGFELDGNCASQGNLDWDSPEAGNQPVDDDGFDDATQYSGGSESDPVSDWTTTAVGTAGGKQDIGEIYAWSQVDGGDLLAYFGFTRQTATGSVGYAIELNQQPNSAPGLPSRTAGDLRFLVGQTGNNPLALDQIDRWSGTAWVNVAIVGGFAIGTAPTFVEIGLNLTDLVGLAPGCPPAADFSQLNLRSSSSPSLNSNLGDFAATSFSAPNTCAALQVTKNVVGVTAADQDQPFEFSLTGEDNFFLSGNDSSAFFDQIVPGNVYTLTELGPSAAWTAGELTCSADGQPFGDSDGASVTFTAPAGDGDDATIEISCAITNTTSGLVVAKDGAGDGSAEFSFGVSGAPATPYTLSLGGDTGVIAYEPGTTVTITETVPVSTPGWVYQGAECVSDAEGAQPVDFEPGEIVEVDTVGGEVITCTFGNVQNGQINVVKTGEPADGGPFGFDTNYGDNTVAPDGIADFSLFIDDPADNSGDLVPGEYTIVELLDEANLALDPDFTLGDVSCEISAAGSGDSTFVTASGDPTAVVTLAAGDIVDCTYTNVQAGRLIVDKTTDGADDTFTFTGAVDGSITTDGGATTPGDELVVDLAPGMYDVSETVPGGWDLVGATCDDGSGSFATGEDAGGVTGIEVGAGEIVTCTFDNERETATLTLTKEWGANATDGDGVSLTATGDDFQTDGPGSGDSTVGGDTTPAAVTIHPGETVTLEEAYEAGNVGSYEASLVCVPAEGGELSYVTGDLGGLFQVVEDDPVDVTCTFTNERLTADLTLEKVWVNAFDGDTADITASGTNSDTTTSTAPDTAPVTIEVLSGESVDLSEILGAGNTGSYTTELECTDAAGLTYVSGELSGTYDVPAMPADVTCTFTNTRTSTTLTLDKNWVDPADGDSVDLTIAGEAGEGTGTVAGDGDPDDAASLTVYSGETVSLDEVFNPGDADWYSTSLTCSLAGVVYTPDALSGSLAITSTDAPITCTFLNVRETAQVIVAKDVAPDTDTGLFDLSVNGDVEFDDAGDGDASDPVSVFVGDPVAVSEAGGTGTDLANYDSELACDNGIVPAPNSGTSGEFTVVTADVTVTCTFMNTRQSATLTLTKDWVNGAAGDTVALEAEGDSSNSAAATGDSTAPDTDNDVVVTVWAGETVDLEEIYGLANVGSYTAELECTDAVGLTYTPGSLAGTYDVPSDPVDVTCTFTNTRTSALVTLEKEWVDGAAGDTADLDITATLGQDPADGATATADGTLGSYNDGTQVTAEVLSGETVGLDELLGAGNIGSYDTDLACDADGLSYDDGELDGELTMPKTPTPVTCTFTNTRTRVTLVLAKEWVDGEEDDVATLGFVGDVASPSGDSTATGAAGSEVDSPVASGEVLSGEVVAIEELLDAGNAAVYATTLACDGGDLAYDAGELDGDLTVPSDATEDITCTFTNEAARGTIVIVKNVEGADGTFDFTGDWPDPDTGTEVGDFQMTTSGGTESVTHSGVLVPADGSPYTVTEVDPTPDYDGTNLECVELGGDDGSSADGLVGTIDLDVGETVTCTYTNTQRSTITVVKDAVPNDDQAFTFTTSGDPLDPTFDLVDDGTDAANSWTSELISANESYSVAETSVDGWDLTSATCDNGDAPDDIVPAPGANVTCTFINEAQPGSVVVTKTVEGVADTFAWTFDIAIDPVDAGVTSPQAVSGVGNTSDSVTFEPLTLNSTYTITEPVMPAGWEQSSFTCDVADEDAVAAGYQVTITDPEQVINCDIVNTVRPSEVEVTKTVAGVADTFEWSFDFTIDPATDGEDATQTASGTGDGDATVGWGNLVPGTEYTITESSVAGFTPGALTCSGVEDSDDNPLSVTFEASLDTEEGAEVTCDMTNTAVPGEVEVTKTVEGTDEGEEWSFDFTIDPAPAGQDATQTASGAGDATVGWDDLVPGETYTIVEGDPGSMWVAGDITCEVMHWDETTEEVDPAAGIMVEVGDSITCDVTNVRRGDLTIDKTLTDLDDSVAGEVTVTYDLVVTGDSPVDESYTVTDEVLFGEGVEVTSSSVTSADATVNAGWDGITDLDVTDGAQVLPVGATHTYVVTATATVAGGSTEAARDCELTEGETGTGTLNEATVIYDNGSDTDDDCGDVPNPMADLQVVKDGPATIHLAADQDTAAVEYTMTVTNLGPDTAVDAMLVDTLPEGLDDVEVATTVGTCDVAALVITCDLGDMASGDEVVVEVWATTTPFIDDTFTNVVEVSSSTPDPDLDNNRDEVTTHITRQVLPKTGADLDLLGLLAALLLMAGLAIREVGRARRPRA